MPLLLHCFLTPATAASLAHPPQVCPPAWFAANVVHHPVRLQRLVAAFLEAFAFDASIAGMLLYAGAPPAGAATSYAAAAAGATAEQGAEPAGAGGAAGEEASGGAQHSQQQLAAQGGSAGSVVLLPRMPLGLVLITTAATYEAAASALRAAAALAVAGDAVPGSSGTALRRLVDAFTTRLQQVVEAGAACSSESDGGSHPYKRSRRRSRLEQEQGAAEGSTTGELQVGGQQPWQLQVASVAVVLAELLLGASPAWQPSWHPAGGQAGSSDSSSGSSRDMGDNTASMISKELELLAAAVVQELVQEAVWSLPTSALQAASPTGAATGAAPLLPAAAGASGQRLTAQRLGCNALLLRAALECCGAAARALGPRFAQNGRLLRVVLLPLLDKLGELEGSMLVAAHAGLTATILECTHSLGASALPSCNVRPALCCMPAAPAGCARSSCAAGCLNGAGTGAGTTHRPFPPPPPPPSPPPAPPSTLPAADGAQLVSSAAQAAVGSVCWWCGYGGSLRRLLASNADYVVDGMCAQLRQVRLFRGGGLGVWRLSEECEDILHALQPRRRARQMRSAPSVVLRCPSTLPRQ